MSHHHGAYTPPEPPLSFDAREPVRGAGPMPTTLIASVVLLAVVAGGGIMLLRHGQTPAAPSASPPVVGTPIAETRAPAPVQTAQADPAAGLQVYRTEAPDGPAPRFVPPPETPTARNAPPPQITTAHAPAETVTVMPPAAPTPAATTTTARAATAPAAASPVARPRPSPSLDAVVESARRQSAPARTEPRATALTVIPTLRAPVSPPDAVTRIAAPARPPAARAAVADAAPPATATPLSGGTSVQIGAFSSNSLAQAGLANASRVSPTAAAGRGRRIEPVSVNGQTLYRTALTGFASRADAARFCDSLRNAGQTCFVR